MFGGARDQLTLKTSDLPITFLKIDKFNVEWVKDLRGEMYVEQFHNQLSMGDSGYYAMLDNKPVAYGWCKHAGSDEYFFRISEGVCYLCRFFTHESVRGHGIQPALLSKFITEEEDCQYFYLAIERGNVSSERGVQKIGFQFIKEFGFIRGFKKTLNKFTLR